GVFHLLEERRDGVEAANPRLVERRSRRHELVPLFVRQMLRVRAADVVPPAELVPCWDAVVILKLHDRTAVPLANRLRGGVRAVVHGAVAKTEIAAPEGRRLARDLGELLRGARCIRTVLIVDTGERLLPLDALEEADELVARRHSAGRLFACVRCAPTA